MVEVGDAEVDAGAEHGAGVRVGVGAGLNAGQETFCQSFSLIVFNIHIPWQICT